MKGVKCAACGFVGWADQETCKKCGAAIASPAVESYPASAQSFADQPQAPTANYQPNYQYWPPPARDLKQGLAITSLVIGCINFMMVGFLGLGPITGLTFGIVALSKAGKRPSEYGGKGLAIAGVVTNSVYLLVLLPIVMAIAIPNLLASRQAANEASAIQSLRSIGEAEVNYYRTRQRYGTLTDLVADHLVNSELATGMRNGYKFDVRPSNKVNSVVTSFEATAVPVEYGMHGRRSFLIDETGVVRAANMRGGEATRASRPLDDGRSSFRSDDD